MSFAILHDRLSGMAKFKAIVFAGLVVLSVAGCNKTNEGVATPPQHWKDSDIRIETHPNPPIAGMSEIVVIVTGAHGRPTHDLIISLRSSDSMPWVRAIQDGPNGVYRRAVDIKVSTG